MPRELYRTPSPVTLKSAPTTWSPEQGQPPPDGTRHDFTVGPIDVSERFRFSVVEHGVVSMGPGMPATPYTRTPRVQPVVMVTAAPYTPNAVMVNVSGADATYSLVVEAV